MFKIGIDVGGTFTDLYGRNGEKIYVGKSLTTPDDISRGIMNVINEAEIELEKVDVIVHASTIATNALIQRNYYGWWPKACFITTDGFRDSLEIGRYNRKDMYDLYQEDVKPLISRQFRFTVPEKTNAEGKVTKEVDKKALRALARELEKMKIDSIGITFINSYINPENEFKAMEILQNELPNVPIAVSAEICPKFRELGRMTTVAVHTLLKPIITKYIDSLEETLENNSFNGKLLMVKDDGGIITSATMKQFPAFMLSSGPAAGVHSGVYYSTLKGMQDVAPGDLGAGVHGGLEYAKTKKIENVLTQDMGGTSYDVCIIEGGEILLSTEKELDVDQPIILPMIDVRAIGAGGGSIAWLDQGLSLKVGPQSAGAKPGPACYGLGGEKPTVTDANIVLGRCPENLGKKLKLNKEAAFKAIKAQIADPLGMDTVEAAEGIIKILTSNISMANNLVTTSRGRDPRHFTPLVYGGAGGMHICPTAEELGLTKAVCVFQPGVYSAVGATTMPIKIYVEKTLYTDITASTDIEKLKAVHDELSKKVIKVLVEDEGAVKDEIELKFFGELRYVGQTYEVMVEIPSFDRNDFIEELQRRFHETHQKEYFISNEKMPISLVNVRLDGKWKPEVVQIPRYPKATYKIEDAKKKERDICFDGTFIRSNIYDFSKLMYTHVIEGPAVVESEHSTIVVFPSWRGIVDEYRGIELEKIK